MNEYGRLYENVRSILLAVWDPIGIRDVTEARDEYDNYVMPVAKMLLDGHSAIEISRYLLGVEIDSMGLKGDNDRALAAAQRLRPIKVPERRP